MNCNILMQLSDRPWYARRYVRLAMVLTTALSLSHCAKPEPSFWSESERAILTSISLSSLRPPPTPHSNRVANDDRAIALGKALFFDKRLSAENNFSCATCHQPRLQFTDGLTTGHGVNPLSRNTPSIIGGAWQSWFYWDGRRDSLWSQALIPIEAPDEMGGSRTTAVKLIGQNEDYLAKYTELFGPLSPALAPEKLPDHAGEFTHPEGQQAWFRLPQPTRNLVNAAYANIGKSIAASERTLKPKPSAFDRYVEVLNSEGEKAASSLLDPAAINGARLFINVEKTRCMQCHNGPLLTNGDFHNIGTGNLESQTSAPGQVLDFGRLFGVQAVLLDQFNCMGPHSDADQKQCSALRFLSREQHGDSAGAYKTPSLRNVAQTAPYFHNGRLNALLDVMRHYNSPPSQEPNELVALNLTEQELADLIAFLESLNSPVYTEFDTLLDLNGVVTAD